jgi:hypothetical protein
VVVRECHLTAVGSPGSAVQVPYGLGADRHGWVPRGAIHQQAVQGGVAVASNVGADPKRGLVGRSAELGQIRLAVRQVAEGAGQAMLIIGEAGIGKTRVVIEGLDAARQLGIQVFWGAAEELERRAPLRSDR